MRRITGCLALCLCAVITLVAQHFPIRNYSIRDGLTRNAVRAIHQDAGGRMWFASTDGLDRYDGAAFAHFTTADGLANDFVNHITEDSTGTIWIATNFGGLSTYRSGRFAKYLPSPDIPSAFSNSVNHVLIDSKGRLWVATDGGLFLFDGEKFFPINLQLTATTIAEDSSGTIWVGATDGLMKLENGGTPQLELGIANIAVFSLVCDRNGILWIGTKNGLRVRTVEPGQPWQAERLINRLHGEWIRTLAVDPDNTLWIGTDGMGAIRFTRDGMITTIDESNGLAGNTVLDIVRDREGNVWFGTTTGLSKLVNEQIINYTRIYGLPDYAVSTVTRDVMGAMWFGTRFGLARLENGRMRTYTARDGFADDYVLTLLTGQDGTLWCGTESGPTSVTFDGDQLHLKSYRSREGWTKINGKKNRVRAMYQDDEGNLWFGNDNGISLYRDRKFIHYPIDGEYGDRLVAGILRDTWGDLWVGLHGNGILRFQVTGSTKHHATLHLKQRIGIADGLKDDHIRCAGKTRQGDLWFGTRFGGAVRIIPEAERIGLIRSYTTDDGLASNWVNSFVEDQRGNLWFGTSRGVTRFTFSSSDSDAPAVRTLTVFDGIAGDGVNAIYEDVNGFLWFATYNGVTRYDAANDAPPRVPPSVYITNVVVAGQADTAMAQKERAELPYEHHSIAFEFVGISFRDEARVRYKYMLEGFDTTWSGPTDRRYAQYTHLPPGDYVFKVSALNGEGVWSAEPALFSFTVVPPIWARWWFIAGLVIVLATTVWLVHRYRVRHLLALERVRLRIAADLHDDVGSTLSSIAIASEVARKEVSDNTTSAADTLTRITANARAMLERLDDIVWTINPSNDSLDEILLRMQGFAAEILETKGIVYTIAFPEQSKAVRIPMEMRRHLYLIFKEAVNNVARHSECTKVEIRVEVNAGKLTLVVKDNGKGFDARTSFSGNGLRTMQGRAVGMGGGVVVHSDPGSGTTLCITAPLT